jgi:hypothetical protein
MLNKMLVMGMPMVGAMVKPKFDAFCGPRDRSHRKDLDE